jgi:hypothetical protein
MGVGAVEVPVTVVDVNRPPVVGLAEAQATSPRCGTALPLQCVISENDVLTLDVTVSDDADESIPSLTLTAPPAIGAETTFVPAPDNRSAVFTFSPGFTDAADVPYEFSFDAADSKGAHTAVRALVTVENLNRPPSIGVTPLPSGCTSPTPTSLQCTVAEGAELAFDLTVTDPDPDDSIVLFIMDQPTNLGASFSVSDPHNRSAHFRLAPTYFQGGGPPVQITFSAQDSHGASAQMQLSLTITNVNLAPVVTLASGMTGSKNACTQGPTPVCYVDYSPNSDSALVLKLSVTDPDAPGAVLRLQVSSNGAPQLGSGFDPVSGIFTFSPRDTVNTTFQVTFSATDRDPLDPKTGSLSVTIQENAPNVPPTVTLHDCPTSVLPGQAVTCTVTVDDPDPRDRPLNLTATLLSGASFSYDATAQSGTFTLLPSFAQSGSFQVDFTGTDTHAATGVAHYPFAIPAPSPIAIANAFPVSGPISDIAWRPPYLYVLRGNLLLIYEVANAQSPTEVARRFLRGATGLRVDTARNLLLAVGPRSFEIYDVGAAPLAPALRGKFNLSPPDRQIDDVRLRPPVAASPGTLYAFVGEGIEFDSDGHLELLRLDPCPWNGAFFCPVVLDAVLTSLRSPNDPIALNERVNAIEGIGDPAVLLAGPFGYRAFSISTDKLSGNWGISFSDVLPNQLPPFPTSSAVVQPSGVNTYKVLLPRAVYDSGSQSISSYRLSGTGFSVGGQSTFAVANQCDFPAGTPAAAAGAGSNTVVVFSDTGTLGNFDDSGCSVGTAVLSGAGYNGVRIAASLGAAFTRTDKSGVLSFFSLSDTGAPSKGGEISFDADGVIAIVSHSPAAGQLLLYALRQANADNAARIDVFELSNLPAVALVNSVALPGVFPLGLVRQDRYLVVMSATNAPLSIFDVGVTPQSPAPVCLRDSSLPKAGSCRALWAFKGRTGSRGSSLPEASAYPTADRPRVREHGRWT